MSNLTKRLDSLRDVHREGRVNWALYDTISDLIFLSYKLSRKVDALEARARSTAAYLPPMIDDD